MGEDLTYRVDLDPEAREIAEARARRRSEALRASFTHEVRFDPREAQLAAFHADPTSILDDEPVPRPSQPSITGRNLRVYFRTDLGRFTQAIRSMTSSLDRAAIAQARLAFVRDLLPTLRVDRSSIVYTKTTGFSNDVS